MNLWRAYLHFNDTKFVLILVEVILISLVYT